MLIGFCVYTCDIMVSWKLKENVKNLLQLRKTGTDRKDLSFSFVCCRSATAGGSTILI